MEITHKLTEIQSFIGRNRRAMEKLGVIHGKFEILQRLCRDLKDIVCEARVTCPKPEGEDWQRVVFELTRALTAIEEPSIRFMDMMLKRSKHESNGEGPETPKKESK